METEHFTISEKEEGVRLDKLLSERFTLHSRTYFQYLIENDFVLLNGSSVKKRSILKTGDEVEVFFQLTPEISVEPENIPLDILFEDEHIIVVNKPPSMVVHPAPGNREHTFVNALLYHCNQLAETDNKLRPGIVHRLDKDTSGVLIAAKTQLAHQKLISQFMSRSIEKTYLAICIHSLQNITLNAPIGRHPVKRKEMAVIDSGKEAITQFQKLACQEPLSLVLAKPQTGRTHQIRVHLKHLNCPLLGDKIYGSDSFNQKYNNPRQQLHAYKLKFIHPITSQPMEWMAPIPEDMKNQILNFSFL